MQSAGTSARLLERIRRRLSELLLSAYRTATCFKNCDVFLAEQHSEGSTSCKDTPGKSARLSLRACDTSVSSELEHSRATSGAMERSAHDWARMDMERLLNLVRSQTRPTSEESSRRADSNHCGGEIESSRMFSVPCARLAMAHLKPKRTPSRI